MLKATKFMKLRVVWRHEGLRLHLGDVAVVV